MAGARAVWAIVRFDWYLQIAGGPELVSIPKILASEDGARSERARLQALRPDTDQVQYRVVRTEFFGDGSGGQLVAVIEAPAVAPGDVFEVRIVGISDDESIAAQWLVPGGQRLLLPTGWARNKRSN